MAIDRFAEIQCGFDFGSDFLIPVQDSWKVHHLTEITNSWVRQQTCRLDSIKSSAGGFENSSRNARRSAEAELEFCLGRIA